MEILIGAFVICFFGGIVFLITLKKNSRRKIVEVNCWFCGKDTQVPFGNKTCWDCPYCEQYNGFTEDGDYNKPIPAQYSENLNHPVCIENRRSDAFHLKAPTLCDTCNRSQLLKIKQLSSFVPYSEVNYDMEVESYKYHLEQVYKLCKNCEQKVNQVIDTQTRRLQEQFSEYELKTPDVNDRSQSVMENSFCTSHLICQLSAPWHVNILRFSSSLCAVALFLISTLTLLQHSAVEFYPEVYLPHLVTTYLHRLKQGTSLIILLGLVSGLVAIYCFGKSGLHICDALSSATWLSLMAFHSHVTKKFKPEDLILLQALLAGLNMVVCLWGFVCPRYENSSSTRLTKKRRSTNSPFSNNSSPAKSNHKTTPQQRKVTNSNKIDREDLEKFETMSIGTPSQRGHGKGLFSLNHHGSPSMASNPSPQKPLSLSSLRQRKPLISPARFKPTISSPTTSTRPRQLFSAANRKPGASHQAHDQDDRESLFSEARYNREQSDSEESESSASSLCPVDSTNQTDLNCHVADSSKRSVFTRVLLGASIGINLSLLLYFWLDVDTLPADLVYVKDMIVTRCQAALTKLIDMWTYITRENFEEALQETSQS